MSAVKVQQVPSVSSLPPGHPDEFVGKPVTPAEQIRVLLARKKRQGITDWERVWDWAVKRVRWPHDHDERMVWKFTIAWSEDAFRDAYEGKAPVVDMSALMALSESLAA